MTKEMINYEEETGKKAIWRGDVTEGFKRWRDGQKIYGVDKKGIGILVSEEIKTKWEKFGEEKNFSTISSLIRQAVNFYIDNQQEILSLENFSTISRELKRPLTSIKGFAQFIIDKHKNELSWDVILKVKEIIDSSILLENKIKNLLEHQPVDKEQCEILIVDDDESTLNLLIGFFESKGYKCKKVFLGNEAIEFLKNNSPKLILLDILLPDISGYEICKIIKSNTNLKNIPVYYITAVTKSEVNENLKETKADGYFLKPFNLEELNVLFEYLKIK
ncbi:MAG: hypothetical protein CEE42_13370 [Promethearchaeota archaeon Loki_b31]|nr:MAG: hypothetical protein CEE42_13370 [Candidatus Lokiarchaeota archaeon Loki_b31]